MIEIQLLAQLEAFSRLGTLSAVAEELYLTQPSISRSMQKLETELGVTLFTRSKNRITLNENGLIAAKYAKKNSQKAKKYDSTSTSYRTQFDRIIYRISSTRT